MSTDHRQGRSTSAIQYAVAYIRVSSEEQAKADRFSLPAQRKEIERHCKQCGWTLVKLYADEGHSAKGSDLSKRPQFRQMLEDVKSGTVRCDVIVTHTLDRYARNLVVALTTLADLHQHGITYSSVTESDFDYSNPDKRLHLSILAMFAEYFSEKLSQHTRKGKRERAASGLPNGDIAYGYINPDIATDKSGNGIFNTTVPVQLPDEAAHVRRAFEAYASGTYSDLDVAKMLNSAGSRTRNKWAGGSRPWSKDTITALLTNAFYAGWIEYRGQGVKRSEPPELYPGKHEPIVSQELFDRVQEIRKSRTRRAAIPSLQKQTYILAGLAVCAHCRDALRVQTQKRGAYYRCTAQDRQTACSCVRKAARARVVDARLGELIGQLKLAPDWRERALAAAHADVDRDAIQAERERILRRLDKIRKFTIAEIMAPDEYEREKAELMDRLSRLTLPAEVDLDAAAAVLEDLQGLWTHPATTTEDRAAICRRLLQSVVVDTNDDAIIEIHLREELAPLFTVLPAQVYTSCGTDGIRPLITTTACAYLGRCAA